MNFRIVNKAETESAELWIYDDIFPEWAGGIGAKTVRDALKEAADAKSIDVYINSAGGDVFEGLTIYDQLSRHKAQINVLIDGMAMSIASAIAMAGDTIAMSESGSFMIHDPWAFAAGNAREMRELADRLDMVAGNTRKIYTARTGASDEQLVAWMEAETWFTAEEAKEAGFVDSVVGSKQIAAWFDPQRFHNVPKNLAARMLADHGDEIEQQRKQRAAALAANRKRMLRLRELAENPS